MQINITSLVPSRANFLENLFPKPLPQELITNILKILDFSSQNRLGIVNKSWNYQVYYYSLQEYLNGFNHLPRWIGMTGKCGEGRGSLDVFLVEEEARIGHYQIIDEYFDGDHEGVEGSPQLLARVDKLFSEHNRHLFLLGHGKIQGDYSSYLEEMSLEEMSHDLCADIHCVKNFTEDKITLSDPSQTLPSTVFKLIFDLLTYYGGEFSYNKTGQGGTILRLRGIEIVSSETAEGTLKDAAKFFSQAIQERNEKEDEDFLNSLDIEPVIRT